MSEQENSRGHAAAAVNRQFFATPLGAALVLTLIFVVTCVAYFPALQGGFLWDDDANITKPGLRTLTGLGRIWFQLGAAQTYYPLLHTVYWIEHGLWGDATTGYHLASLLFHLVSVSLVYLILRTLRIPGAYLAAAIFALHPVYVESVAWITEQKNTLSGALYLGSVLVYLHFDDSRRRSTYFAALTLFVLSLLTKTITVTLPAGMLVILWWKRGGLSWRRDIAPLIPWFGLSLAAGIFTIWYERVVIGASGAGFVLTSAQKCLLAGRAVWFYLGKLFWPTNLTLFYPQWRIDPADGGQYIYPAALAALLAVAWSYRGRSRAPLAALLFFVVTLFPLLGFFQTFIFRYTYVCDHFQYLPSLGIVALVSATIALAIDRLRPRDRIVGNGLCVALLGVFALMTWQQAHAYTDAVTLYVTTIGKNPNSWLAYSNLGIELAKANRYEEAVKCYETALQIEPDCPEAHNNLGIELARMGQQQEAIKHYQRALQVQSDYADAHYNLARSLYDLGRTQEAIDEYELAIRYKPEYAEAHNNLGTVLKRLGKFPEAIEQFQAAVRLEPNFFESQYNLARALVQVGRTQEGIEHFQRAVELRPNNIESALNLMIAYGANHDFANATSVGQKALELAHSQGQTALAQEIEALLRSYAAGPSNQSSGATSPGSTQQLP